MNKQTIILVLLGLALRLFLIFPGPLASKIEFFYNRADLRNYYWPAQMALRGENPYVLWASGASGDFRSDMAPLELAIYVATVAVWNDPRALQILFALCDALNIVLLGALLQKSVLRTPFQIFYALGPLTLYNLTLVPQDKTILLTFTFALFYLLTRYELRIASYELRITNYKLLISATTLITILAALIAAFKWLSVFYALPLLIHVSRDARAFVKHGALFGAVVALAHVFWLPAWMIVYTFRAGRVVAPMHIAPAALLNALGWFDRTALLGVLVVSLVAIYALFWFKRIDILETITLSVMTGILWTPDMDPVHLAIIVIHFLLIVDWTRAPRLSAVWLLSAWVVFVYAVSTRAGFTQYGLPDLRVLTGVYGSSQMILAAYPLFILALSFYLADKLRRRTVGMEVAQTR